MLNREKSSSMFEAAVEFSSLRSSAARSMRNTLPWVRVLSEHVVASAYEQSVRLPEKQLMKRVPLVLVMASMVSLHSFWESITERLNDEQLPGGAFEVTLRAVRETSVQQLKTLDGLFFDWYLKPNAPVRSLDDKLQLLADRMFDSLRSIVTAKESHEHT